MHDAKVRHTLPINNTHLKLKQVANVVINIVGIESITTLFSSGHYSQYFMGGNTV